MNIKTIDKRTCILMPKHQQEKLVAVFVSIDELKDEVLMWSKSKGYFYVNKILEVDILAEIKKRHKQLFEKPNLITGYTGCPITLNGFKWKV